MKTYLIEDTGDSAIIGFKDANITLITPIMKALYDDSDVEMAPMMVLLWHLTTFSHVVLARGSSLSLVMTAPRPSSGIDRKSVV